VTYLPMAQGFAYLVAILDLYSRKVLVFRVSNTLVPDFCIEALGEALRRHGAPEIFNTDQGSQFTDEAFTAVLAARGVRISMDGKGRWIDNVFVERLWRSVKYESIYLHAYETPQEVRVALARYFEFYNAHRRIRAWDIEPRTSSTSEPQSGKGQQRRMKHGCPTAACPCVRQKGRRPPHARRRGYTPLHCTAVQHLTMDLFLSKPVRPLLSSPWWAASSWAPPATGSS
jgi:Integrase core domain